MNVRSVAALTTLAVIGTYPGTARAGEPARISSFGFWSLGRLGVPGPVVLRRGARVRSVSYVLPESAAQGSGSWYLVRLNFTLVVSATSAPGVVYVEAKTQGHAGASVEFHVGRKGRRRALAWNAIGIVDGIQRGTTASRLVDVRFRNYVQERGVTGGVNTLSFDYVELGGARVDRVEIRPSSGIEHTDRSPALVRFGIPARSKDIHVGDRFSIPFALRNDGGRSAGAVKVHIDYPNGDLRLLGTADRVYRTVDGGVRGRFDFDAVRLGRHAVGIFATSRSNHPGVEIQIEVVPRPSGRPWWGLALLGVGVAGVAAVTVHSVKGRAAR